MTVEHSKQPSVGFDPRVIIEMPMCPRTIFVLVVHNFEQVWGHVLYRGR